MDAFTILAQLATESTAVVIPPTTTEPQGRVVIGLGNPGGIAYRPLLNTDGTTVDNATLLKQVDLPVPTSVMSGMDNQTVLLDGLALMHLRMSDMDSPHSQPWNAEQAILMQGSWVPYNRVGFELYRSDTGGTAWSHHATIDPAIFNDGKYGYPRPANKDSENQPHADVAVDQQGTDPAGNKLWWPGGFDRPEMYHCPFTGNLYITSTVAYGPYPGYVATRVYHPVVLVSYDGGQVWRVLLEIDGAQGFVPLVMTSTPSGHLIVYSNQPNNLWRIYATAAFPPTIEGPYPVPLNDLDGTTLALGLDDFTLAAYPNSYLHMPCLARLSSQPQTSAVRIALRARDANGRQCILVTTCWFTGSNTPPQFETIDVVRSATSPYGATLYGGLIDIHPAAVGAGVDARTCILIYYDAPVGAITNGIATIRAQRYDAFAQVNDRIVVPLTGGQPDVATAGDPVHCISSYGGAFTVRDSLQFFAHWPEHVGQLRATVLTCTPVFDAAGALEAPTAVAHGAGQLDVIRRALNGSVWYRRWNNGPDWIPPVDLGNLPLYGEFEERMAVSSWAPDRLDIVGRSTDRAYYHKTRTAAGWYPAGRQWEPLGGGFLDGPAIVSRGAGRLNVFGRGLDRAMYHKAWTPTTGWIPKDGVQWENLGGTFGSAPVAVAWGLYHGVDAYGVDIELSPSHISVFGLDPDGALWHKAWDSDTGTWTPPNWEPLYGKFLEVPAAVSWGLQRLDVVGRSTDGAYYHKYWAAPFGWAPAGQKWEPLGGGFLDGPAIVATAPGQLHVFGRRLDKAIWHKAWTFETGWMPKNWESLGGTFGAAPVAISWAKGRLDVFGVDPAGGLWHKAWEASTNTWTPPNWEPHGQPV